MAASLSRKNIAAGIVGYGWTSLLQLVSTPLLLRWLGAESFGLVGLYIAAQGVSQVFDLGLSPTVNREMARSVAAGEADEAHDLLHTIEPGYWILGLVLGLAVVALAPLVATRWLGASHLDPSAIRLDICLIGGLIAVQWPVTLYEGGLSGLQRIPRLHGIGMLFRTSGVAAGLLALALGARSLSVYLLAMLIASLCHVIVLAVTLRRCLPPATRPPRRELATVYRVWRFAAGMTVLMLLSAVLMHADKLLLSHLLSLEDFGYYTLATMVSAGLYVLNMPVFHAALPVLIGRVTTHDEAGERAVYHLTAQAMTVLLAPATAVIVCFAHPILQVWTGSAEIAAHAAPIAQILIAGTLLNGLVNPIYALQLAHARPRIAIYIHVGLIALFLPALWWAVSIRGVIGAAGVWLALNALYIVVAVTVTHALLLPGATTRWLTRDVLLPAIAGIAAVVLTWLAGSRLDLPPLAAVGVALFSLVIGWLSAALNADAVRRHLVPKLPMLRRLSTPNHES